MPKKNKNGNFLVNKTKSVEIIYVNNKIAEPRIKNVKKIFRSNKISAQNCKHIA